jgi:HJR/Mrr/RecB family endonuclease
MSNDKPQKSECINCGAVIAHSAAAETGGLCTSCNGKELPPEIEAARLEKLLDGYDTRPFYDEFRRRFLTPEILEQLPKGSERMLRHMIACGNIVGLLAIFQNYNVISYLIRSGYASKLISKRRQLEYTDYYGDFNLDPWFHELDRFIERRLRVLQEAAEDIPEVIRNMAKKVKAENCLIFDELVCLNLPIDDFTREAICDLEEAEEIQGVEKPKDAKEYEIFVGKSFKDNGWQVQHVGGTGDQGADLIVTKDDMKAVVQCKFYRNTVGNSAVQEAHAAKLFYGVDAAIVVASSDFTLSCRQLAESCDVLLMIIAVSEDRDPTG